MRLFFRRKNHAGVMLGGTNSIYLTPKTHSKWHDKSLRIENNCSLFVAIRTPFSCHYQGPTISIFAARVHAHQWGSYCYHVLSIHDVYDRYCSSSEFVVSNTRWSDQTNCERQSSMASIFLSACITHRNPKRGLHCWTMRVRQRRWSSHSNWVRHVSTMISVLKTDACWR